MLVAPHLMTASYPRRHPARDFVYMASVQGATILGDDTIGSLAPGKKVPTLSIDSDSSCAPRSATWFVLGVRGKRSKKRQSEARPRRWTARLRAAYRTGPDGDYQVRRLPGSAKDLRRPACLRPIPAGTAHVVAWPGRSALACPRVWMVVVTGT